MTSFEFKYMNYDHKKLMYMWSYNAHLGPWQRLRLAFYKWWCGMPTYHEGD